MKPSGAKQQTVFLTGINAAVRGLGLMMRVCLSRLLGAEVMGIMELAQSVHMLAIGPLTSGLPAAITRLTARADAADKQQPLASGLWLTRRLSLFLIPLFWLFSPFTARLLGDMRVLPSLFFTAPCILILGYSAAYNGYCYGMERSGIPALSELIEQLVRFAVTLCAIALLRSLSTPWLAAVPVAATMTAEVIGLLYVLFTLKSVKPQRTPSFSWTKAVVRLSVPSAVTRIVQTFLRSATAVLIPLRLQAAGLSAKEATAQLGMLNGMVMPILMLPGILTNALSMVMIPKIARAEEKPSELGRLLKLCLLASVPVSIAFACGIGLLAPFLACSLFRQPELTRLFRLSAFQIVLFPVTHLILSTLSALGQQKRAMMVSCLSSTSSLLLTWFFTGNPAFKADGVILAQYISQLMSIMLSGVTLLRWRKKQPPIRGDRCA